VKHICWYFLFALIVIAAYVALFFVANQELVQEYERSFNEQQALQTEMSAQGIEEHVYRMSEESSFAALYVLPPYLKGYLSQTVLQSILSSMAEMRVFKDELAFAFYRAPEARETFYVAPSDKAPRAQELVDHWVTAYWDDVVEGHELFFTPFVAEPNFQVWAVLYPLYEQDGSVAGVAAMATDFSEVIKKYVVPMLNERYRIAWIQDANGLVIYHPEAEYVGRDAEEVARPYPDLLEIVQRMMAEDTGRGEYHFPVEVGGRVERKLVAWSTVYAGEQRLTIALAAPASEINAELAAPRQEMLVLGMLLGLTLGVSGWLFYHIRQRVLEQLVHERTQELEALTTQLEQRVQERTTELARRSAQLQTILENTEDGVLFRQGGQIVYANPAITRLLGYTLEELQAAPNALNPVPSEDPAPTFPAKHPAQVQLQRKDGTILYTAMHQVTVQGPNGEEVGVVETIHDTSYETALQEQKDRFITNASHELRRPLTNLKTRLYLLRRQPERMEEHLTVLQRAADDMSELVQDLVDVSQLMRNRIRLDRRNTQLQYALEGALNLQMPAAQQKQVQLQYTITPEPMPIFGDYQRLIQVFNSLFDYAIEVTSEGGAVHVYTERIEMEGAPWAEICVRDEGETLDPAQLHQLFEPFFRPTEGDTPGTGLGLTLARYVVQQHGGTIHAEVATEGGTRIVVRLPLLSASSEGTDTN